MSDAVTATQHDNLAAARQAIANGQIDLAARYCNDAINENSRDAAAFHLRGLIAMNSDRMNDAQADFNAAHNIDPDNVHYLTTLGFYSRKINDNQKAEDYLRRAIALDDNALIARYQLGNLLLDQYLQAPQQSNIKSVSVIVPSRLEKHPKTGQYWLDRSIRSVLEQTAAKDIQIDVIVGIDPGSDVPPHLQQMQNVRFIEAVPVKYKGQAAAINAAMVAATGDAVTMIEDDDCWHPKRLEYGLQFLPGYEFASCNQLEIDTDNRPQNLNDFPTPCGWLMRRGLWNAVGPMDEEHQYHLDTDWLGRLNKHLHATGGRRCHIVEAGVPVPFDAIVKDRPQLPTLIRWMPVGSAIFRTSEQTPLILRTIHPDSGMAKIRTDEKAGQQSALEHEIMLKKYGYYPW